ncbi:MAG TPA: tetratricopeptide repeat protein [Rhizomicrobium sp.]|jgi:tetratricopeptide (TPR) repeat protein|nr:tetratricopeptide repeat protein [Rhizomicrobium sp.]
MAQALPQPSMDSLAGVDARLEAIDRLEALVNEVAREKARRRSNIALKRGIQAWRRGDIVKASQWALRATEADNDNAKAFHVLGMGLERMGHLHKALVTYERAFELDPEDPELLINLGLTAWGLKLTEGAARMFQLYIAACPDSPLGYNNLGSVQSDMGHTEVAIEILRDAIYRMPDQAILWNSLATVLAEEGRADESIVFYEEAARLEPKFARAYHNLGYAYQHLSQCEKGLAAYDRALELVVDPAERIETRHSRSICLIALGKVAEGWREYEIRNNQRFRCYFHHMIDAPMWQGEDLNGRKLLLVGEQGLGDELMFANILPDAQEAVGENGKLQICVDPRLVPLFQRSFPKAEVGSYDDRTLIDKDGNKALRLVPFASKDNKPDLWAPMGTALQYYRDDLAKFPHKAFLVPDETRVAEFRSRLAALPGKKVGICWRSMMTGAKRAKYFAGIENWGPVFATPGVSFVNIQYGDCAAEIRHAEEIFGITIHQIDGLDLKNDIDGSAALCAALNLVLSAPTAAAHTAASVGAKTWFLAAGQGWPQLGTAEYPWYPDTKVFWPEKQGNWEEVITRFAAELADFAAG